MLGKLLQGLAKQERLVLQVYKDALQPGVQQVGAAIGNLLGFILTPVSRLPKYATDRLDAVLKSNLDKFREEMLKVPRDKVVEVPSELGVPILQKLSYVQDEDLSNLFVNLLTKASSKDFNELAHPSFIDRIGALASDEAKILYHLYLKPKPIPYVIIWMAFETPHGMQKSDKLTNLAAENELLFPRNIPAYLENLISLGILRTHEMSTLSNEAWYEPLYAGYESQRKSIEDKGHDDGTHFPVTWIKGYFELTTYGKIFLNACVAKIPTPT